MDLKLEVVPLPVSDVDAAKAFYTEQVGFRLDHDIRPREGMRVVQIVHERGHQVGTTEYGRIVAGLLLQIRDCRGDVFAGQR